MRTKQWVTGLNNKQRIRAIINGVGFITTIQDSLSGPFHSQTIAVNNILFELMAAKRENPEVTGYGRHIKVYDANMKSSEFDIQVDLI
jgi:hypothetical protein